MNNIFENTINKWSLLFNEVDSLIEQIKYIVNIYDGNKVEKFIQFSDKLTLINVVHHQFYNNETVKNYRNFYKKYEENEICVERLVIAYLSNTLEHLNDLKTLPHKYGFEESDYFKIGKILINLHETFVSIYNRYNHTLEQLEELRREEDKIIENSLGEYNDSYFASINNL